MVSQSIPYTVKMRVLCTVYNISLYIGNTK